MALYPSQVMRPCDDLLTDIASLVEADRTETVEMKHLSNKTTGGARIDLGDAGQYLCALPKGRQRVYHSEAECQARRH